MNLFALLAQATTLPPPPAPKSADSVSALSLVLVVVIVLGSVAMIALSSRRFKRRPSPENRLLPPVPVSEKSASPEESVRQVETPLVDPNLLARLRRVTGSHAVDRRRLGDRKSSAEVEIPNATERAPAATPEPTASADDSTSSGAATATEMYPEPIPIRRRAGQRWQDEPVIAPGHSASAAARSWTPANAAVQGLTSAEVSQLQAPGRAARVASPLLRARPDVVVAKAEAEASANERFVAELSAVVRELLFSANVGELLRGFALYSDAFLFRSMDDTGLSDDEFRIAFAGQPAKPIGEWTRLAALRDLDHLTPNLVEATIVYSSPAGEASAEPERFRFVRNSDGRGWLIDDIRPLR